ncbi:MAG: MBL fold metallo-hydrolase [Actinomycetota bacterium]|nr:MBL fold metallo-hydrolase [Actinomycetota bacterium]
MEDGTGLTTGDGGSTEEVTAGVARLGILFVNAYMVGAPGGPWVLVDSGLPLSAVLTRRAVAGRYGAGARPEAIVLTHGHFDHAGAALDLASGWDVPVYAHRLEMPYLTGKSDYPPQDPTMGGAIAQMARLFPHGGYDFGDRVRPLPDDGDVPGLRDWRWIHTPGHTPGHVSLFRETDGTLLAGDAVATMNLDSWTSQLTRKRELHRPPAPFTPDWGAAGQSVEVLAGLEPSVVAAGHGLPMTGPGVAEELRSYAGRFSTPRRGRYTGRPASADEEGVKEVPPPVPDPLPKVVAVVVTAGAVVATGIALGRRLVHNVQEQRRTRQ